MIKDRKIWESWVKANKDPYRKCCIDVARGTMKLLDDEKHKDFDANKIISEADDNIKAGGITGFMAGCIAQMITKCHSRGEEFKKKWNESYGVKDEKKGAINPALVTISLKEASN